MRQRKENQKKNISPEIQYLKLTIIHGNIIISPNLENFLLQYKAKTMTDIFRDDGK